MKPSGARAAGALLALALARGAGADGGYGSYGYGGPSVTSDDWPTRIVRRPLTLVRGMVEIAAPVGIDLSPGSGGKPVNVPLAVHVGLTDWLTAGIGHARGFCLGGVDAGCATAYDDVRVDALARFYSAGPLAAAYGLALAAAPVRDAIALSAEAQLELRLAYDPIALVLAPSYGFGVTRRDTVSRIVPATFPLATSLAFGTFETLPNRETVRLPVTAELQVSSRLALAAAISLDGVLDPVVGSFGDSYRVPVGFAAVATPARTLDMGVGFTFPNLWGRSEGVRPRSEARVLEAFIALRPGGSRSRPPAGAPPIPRMAGAETPSPAASAAPAPVVPGAAPVPVVAAGGAAPQPAAAYTILVEGFAYAPLSLEVPPGATITVRNRDAAPHSVTSESAPGAFAPGAVAGVSFDTGVFTEGERSFTILQDAPPGTVVPYYCSVHAGRMRTPNGEIRIVAAR